MNIVLAQLGCGYWGPNLLRNFSIQPDCHVKWLAELNPKRREFIAQHYPRTTATADWSAAVHDPAVQAVVIATPVSTHYQLAKAALEAGKHVLVEKPMTMSVAHAEELVALAEKNGLVLQVDHVFVYSPPVIKMKELIDAGKLGKLFFIDSVRINLGLFQSDINVVWDLAPHDLSIVDYLLGRVPRSLSAFGGTHARPEIEDVAYLTLDFGDGLIASFHVNWLSPVKVRHMIVGGSERSLLYNDLDLGERIKVYSRGINLPSNEASVTREVQVTYRSGDVWSPNLANEEPLARMAAHFLACIRDRRRPITDGQSGLRVVRILEAAQRSIKTQGARVTV